MYESLILYSGLGGLRFILINMFSMRGGSKQYIKPFLSYTSAIYTKKLSNTQIKG